MVKFVDIKLPGPKEADDESYRATSQGGKWHVRVGFYWNNTPVFLDNKEFKGYRVTWDF